MFNLSGKTVLVTGATGSFGTEFIRTVLRRYDIGAVRAFSRDELKQSELRRVVDDPRLKFLLGDVRDLERLRIATRGVDVIVHAAALKQVPAAELDPLEAVKTNVLGTENVITVAMENRVSVVMGLSTDKAPAAATLYGATKLCAERLLAQAGVYAGSGGTRFGAVRYGNVIGSRGSVVQVFREQSESGTITLTDERMTRFWLTLSAAVEFVLSSLPLVEDGETFIPKVPSAKLVDLAEAIAPGVERVVTGIRYGEKLHEVLLTEDEAPHSRDLGDRFLIEPYRIGRSASRGTALPRDFSFRSNTNDHWLSVEDLRTLLATHVPVGTK